MNWPTPDITLDVDLRNPGQFFACCGVLELASRLWPANAENNWHEPEGWFAANGSRATFQVATYSGHSDPLGEIVRSLCEGKELVVLAEDHEAQAQEDRKPVIITLAGLPTRLRLDWWLDSYRGGDKSELKVWAGQQTPKRNINGLREAWQEVLKRKPDEIASRALFIQRWPMTGRFGFDPSASWEARDVGFSPDEQQIGALTSPSTEILAVIGLQRCRPRHIAKRSFAYRAWADPIAIAMVPAAISGAGRALSEYKFPVVMRNAQYGRFGWARPLEVKG